MRTSQTHPLADRRNPGGPGARECRADLLPGQEAGLGRDRRVGPRSRARCRRHCRLECRCRGDPGRGARAQEPRRRRARRGRAQCAHGLVSPADPRREPARTGVRGRHGRARGPNCAAGCRPGSTCLSTARADLAGLAPSRADCWSSLGGMRTAAIEAVRAARPGAIETAAQQAHVRGSVTGPGKKPDDRDRTPGATAPSAPCWALPSAMRWARRSSSARGIQSPGSPTSSVVGLSA